eukprot:CAMPEP_0180276466 /NCGR_PEP_ID=MMETSP0988-20121125/6376_1 /TAXON_ID=697907 /ORGANISM="non described non described, Strain CCMP2293" /LENGTH=69 /DNA_ID=CAMNT_0022247771 /DNA_START=358 /DNA_END=567 /DNA_ORIENTATION=+
MMVPSTPVMADPEWMPILMLSASPLCGARTSFTAARIANAMSAVAVAWAFLSPMIPPAIMYASPIVPTL